MTHRIWLVVPPRIPANPFDPERVFPPMQRIEIELGDGPRVVDEVMDAIRAAHMENYDLRAIVLPAVPYFTLREHMRELVTRQGGRDFGARGFTLDGVNFILDPARDVGPLLPLYDEDSAIHIYAKRRTPQATDTKEGK